MSRIAAPPDAWLRKLLAEADALARTARPRAAQKELLRAAALAWARLGDSTAAPSAVEAFAGGGHSRKGVAERDTLLTEVAGFLAEQRNFAGALQAVQAIKQEAARSAACRSLAASWARAGSAESALQAARAVAIELDRAHALCDVAEGLAAAGHGSQAVQTLLEAAEVARSVERVDVDTVIAVQERAATATGNMQVSIGSEGFDRQARRAEKLSQQADRLKAAGDLPERILNDLVALGALEEALRLAQSQPTRELQDEQLCSIVFCLAEAGQAAKARPLLPLLSAGPWKSTAAGHMVRGLVAAGELAEACALADAYPELPFLDRLSLFQGLVRAGMLEEARRRMGLLSWETLRDLAQAAGGLAAVRALVEQALALPDDPAQGMALLHIGAALARLGDHAEARATLARASRLLSRQEEFALADLAVAQTQARDDAGAAATLRRIPNARDTRDRARLGVATARAARGDLEEAAQEARAIRSSHLRRDGLCQVALAAIRSGDWSTPERIAAQVEPGKGRLEWWSHLVEELLNVQETRSRSQAVERALESAGKQLDPQQRADLLAQVGYLMANQNDRAGAIALLRRAQAAAAEIDSPSDHNNWLSTLLHYQIGLGDVEAVRDRLQPSPGSPVDLLQPLLNLALVQADDGDPAGANETLQRARDHRRARPMDDHSAQAALLAPVLAVLGQTAQAEEELHAVADPAQRADAILRALWPCLKRREGKQAFWVAYRSHL